MPITVTETLLDASGSAALTKNRTVIIDTLGAPAAAESLGLIGATRVTLKADASGSITADLLPGLYEMRWQIGTRESVWTFAVPSTGGPYLIRHLGAGSVESGQRQGWRFAGINAALIQFRNASNGAWHTPFVSGASPQFAVGAADNQADGPNWKEEGTTWWLINTVGGSWHALSVSGSDSAPVLDIGAAGVAVANNHRLKNGRHQFRNTSTGHYHSLFITGAPGAETYALGPGEA